MSVERQIMAAVAWADMIVSGIAPALGWGLVLLICMLILTLIRGE